MKQQSQLNQVFTAIKHSYCRTTSEVSLETGLPVNAVSANIKSLRQMGWIEACGTYPSVAGEPEKVMYQPTDKPSDHIEPYDPSLPCDSRNGIILRDIAADYYSRPWKRGAHTRAAKKFNVSLGTVQRALRKYSREDVAA